MDQPSEPILLSERRDAVLHLTLNRPAAYNSLSRELLGLLEGEIARLETDKDVRVVVLSGNGKAFCAGHDLKEMRADRRYEPGQGALLDSARAVMLGLTRLPQPVIALVDGIAFAAGCQLVAACDLAIATTKASSPRAGVKYGLFCSTPMVALSRNIARKPAMEMLLTGDSIDAAEALRQGLVNQVVPKPRSSTRPSTPSAPASSTSRRPCWRSASAPSTASSRWASRTAYAFTTEVIVENALGRDFEAGLDAFVAKKKPVWPAS